MITKAQKQEIIDGLIEKFRKASGVYVLNYEKMPVDMLNNFRNELKSSSIDVQVAKNTLILRAMKEVEGIDIPADMLVGQSLLAFGYDDPILPAKLIKEFLTKGKTERPALKAVSIEGQIYDSTKLDVVAKLPSREDMIAGIIGSISAPISGIVGALDQATPLVRTVSAVTRDLISVIYAVAEKQNKAA